MRRYAGDDVRQVLVIGGFDAPRRLRRRTRRADPGPTSVELTRATVIDATPLGELDEADAWLERACGDDRERVTGEALALLNRAVAGHRVASADPWVPDADPTHALVCRVGYGTGEQVAEGDWESARELPLPAPAAAPARWSSRPQERLAALLSGRDAALACEELTLRARGDLDHGRPREAALQLAIALDAALAELEAWREQGDMARRLEELDDRRGAVAEAARAALAGGSTTPRCVDGRSAARGGVASAALRARRSAGGGRGLGARAATAWRSSADRGRVDTRPQRPSTLPRGPPRHPHLTRRATARRARLELVHDVAVEPHRGAAVVRRRALRDDRHARRRASSVISGSSATGQTSSEEPMQSIRSAPAASADARFIAASSSSSPNSTTSGLSGRPQSQRGTPSSAASSRARVSASG